MLRGLVEPYGGAVTRQSSRSEPCDPYNRLGVNEEMQSRSTLTRRQDGQPMAEYGVALAVITLAVAVALAALSGAIGNAIDALTGIL